MFLYFLNLWLIFLLLLIEIGRLISMLHIRRQVHARTEADPLRFEDCSALRLDPPGPLRPILQQLESAGFTRLGEIQTVGGLIDPPLRAWCMVDSTHTIACDTFLQINLDKPPLLGFNTAFEQGHVATSVQQPDVRLRDVYDRDFWVETIWPGTVTGAYQRHQDVVRQYAIRLGEPTRCQSVDDYLRLSYEYMERYSPRRRTGRKHRPDILAMLIVGWGEPIGSILLLAASLLVAHGWPRLVLSLLPLPLFFIQFAFTRLILQDFLGKKRLFRQPS